MVHAAAVSCQGPHFSYYCTGYWNNIAVFVSFVIFVVNHPTCKYHYWKGQSVWNQCKEETVICERYLTVKIWEGLEKSLLYLGTIKEV